MSSNLSLHSWELREGSLILDDFVSLNDMVKLGLEKLVVELRVHQLEFDNNSGDLLNNIRKTYLRPMPYGILRRHDDIWRHFFNRILLEGGVLGLTDEIMIEKMIYFSRTIIKSTITSTGTTRSNIQDPVPLMIIVMRVEEEPEVVHTFVPASKSSIEALDKVEVDSSCSIDQCVICLEKFSFGVGMELVTRMPCSHVYHGDCIGHWLQLSHYCPICRFEMPT
ncbi:ERAD-associated E3 ubiquitin-protein ligase HRD1-like [Cornus florida]|uniref:ERAD-associated E3 ubiquitin-protein ligase HRD1-like n=1 Tax=Cornus florida TaxID=4283 RepID=UPI0028999C6D|nr:ERAD-associated E3 ubiquitin-protein ligase HRD1-like [Cornus florida]XP_059651273.1 ERAD-associated E3 ubiquitin-protein ligase HRD1-like [Cornus florida]XP_059651274.1 ERAD-associated E3 ubiquitin-protein ligase HRD1-like [Cornus florida]